MEVRIEIDADLRLAEPAPVVLVDAFAFAPGDEVEHRVGIVLRNVEDREIVAVVRRNQHREWSDKERNAQIVVGTRILDRPPNRNVAKAEVGPLDLQARCLVGRRAQPFICGRAGAIDLRRHHVGGMQAGAMRRIDRPFEHLRPVAADVHFHDARADVGRGRPRRRLEVAHLVRRSHPHPHEAAGLAARIHPVSDLFREHRFVRLGRPIHDVAFDVDLPAVIEAAQPALFVAPQRERCTSMRAMLVEHADPALGIAKRYEVLAEEPHTDGRSIAQRDLLGQTRRDPVTTHQAPHRGVAFDAAEQLVVFGAEHASLQGCAAGRRHGLRGRSRCPVSGPGIILGP